MTAPLSLSLPRLLEMKEKFTSAHDLPFEFVQMSGESLPEARESPARQPLCALLCGNPSGLSCCHAEHRRAIDWAFQTGEPYSFVCHAGLLVTCTPVADGQKQIGAILTGKTLPEKPGDAVVSEVKDRLSIFGFTDKQIEGAVNGHKNVPGVRLQKAASELYEMIQRGLQVNMEMLDKNRTQSRQQSEIAETIQAAKEQPSRFQRAYPFDLERELAEAVRRGDHLSARATMNEILGTVLFQDPMNITLLKTRLVELLAVLSRATAEAGVDVNRALSQNVAYFRKIVECNSDYELCVTVSNALNSYLETVCASRPPMRDTPAQRVLTYLENNYAREITVDELAAHVHLSASRISHVFQDEMGKSMMQALLQIRIKRAKEMLINTNLNCTEIGCAVGFKEQSYFTRIFRKLEKTTPRKFRSLSRAGQKQQLCIASA